MLSIDMRRYLMVSLLLVGCAEKDTPDSPPSVASSPAQASVPVPEDHPATPKTVGALAQAPGAEVARTAASGKDRNLSGFHSIKLMGSIDLEVSQGTDFSVVIDASAEDLSKVVTEVADETLSIFCRDKDAKTAQHKNGMPVHTGGADINIRAKGEKVNLRVNGKNVLPQSAQCGKVTAKVRLPTITALVASGAGKVRGMTPFKTKGLVLKQSGSGKMDLNVESTDLNWEINGSGEIKLGGTSAKSSGVISGSGSLHSDTLKAKSVSIKVSGSGNAVVDASESLDVNVSGSGSVIYSGSPQLTKTVRGSGQVTKR